MSNKSKVKVEDIAFSPLFAGVPSNLLKRATKLCTAREYPAGSSIITEGEIGDFMFIVLDGEIDIIKGVKKVNIATLGKGVFIGEGALLNRAPRSVTVAAKTYTRIAIFDKKGFDKLSILHPSIPMTIMNAHIDRCKDTVSKMSALKSKEFLLMAAIGVVLFVKYSHSVLPPHLHPLADQLSRLIPDEVMAFGGPAAAAFVLKLKKMEMNNIVSKLDKI